MKSQDQRDQELIWVLEMMKNKDSQNINFIFNSDDEEFVDSTDKRRNQNRNIFSIEDFQEFTKEDKVKDIWDESDNFFDLVYNHYEEIELKDQHKYEFRYSDSTDSSKQSCNNSRLSIFDLYGIKQNKQKSSIESTNIEEFKEYQNLRRSNNASASSESNLRFIRMKMNE